MKHGTVTGYTSDDCRCDDCRAAMAAYNRRRTFGGDGTVAEVDTDLLSDLLNEIAPDGLTDDCPARRAKVAS